MVGVGGLEPPASWSRTKRATSCATPRQPNYYTVQKRFCQEGNFPPPRRFCPARRAHTLNAKGGDGMTETKHRRPARRTLAHGQPLRRPMYTRFETSLF